MPASAAPSGLRRSIAVAALAVPLAASATDSIPPEVLSVKVFPDRYVAAGKPFADLASLDAWARTIHIRTVWLDACGNASATRVLAAAERFQPVYTEGVQIRTLAPGDPGCLEAVPGQTSRLNALPATAAYLATDRYGRSVLP